LIKRIQSRLSSKNIKLTRDQIVAELHKPVESLEDSDVSGIVEYFLQSNPPVSSTSIQTVSNSQKQPETLTLQDADQAETFQDSTNSSPSAIVLTDSQKHSLIQNTSQQLGITLVGEEVKGISRSVASQFSDRRQMLLAVTEAIKAFNERIAAEEQELLNDFLNAATGQLSASNQNIKSTFNNLEAEISQSNLDFKSVQTDIFSLFTIS
jgi:hypothetical protein